MFISVPTIIWFDSNLTNSIPSKISVDENLRTFTDISSCTSYIKSHSDEIIFLIVSDSFISEIMKEIHDLSNISMIFYFCISNKSYTDSATKFHSKLLTFDDEDDLIQRLWSEMETYFREQAKQSTKQANQCKERAKKFEQSCG
ncbi:hypothetical protein I4U23_031196 [Adineta vaga]|nr:hypothetical protein I4U23_031196 [Adineta vaga]